MAFLGSLLRTRRGEFQWILLAAMLALLVMPGATHAAIAPQSAEAVLLWLQTDAALPGAAPIAKTSELLSLSHQKAEIAPQIAAEIQLSAATSHCGQHLTLFPSENTPRHQSAPATPTLERHAAAHLSGVRTNRRLN